MLIVVSPSKSLDLEAPLPTRKHSEPLMLDRSAELVTVLADKAPEDLGELMSISDELAELNFERYQSWERPFTPDNSRPAVLTFSGDVYLGLDAESFSERDFTHAQKTLRILSGLYGVLRPLDLMQPYRLEMGTKLGTDRGRDLYGFWDNEITEVLNADLQESPGSPALVNLASNEYFNAVHVEQIDGKVVTPVFLDADQAGNLRMVSFFAKKARGTMARWIIQDRIKSVRALREFEGMGYRFDPERSTTTTPTFCRGV